MIEIPVKVSDLLADISKEPTAAVPPGLWQPLAIAIADAGDTSAIVQFTPNGDLRLDGSGLPLLVEALEEIPDERKAFGLAVVELVRSAYEPTAGHKAEGSNDLYSDHGLDGAQLRFKKALIDHAHTEYVAGGRLPDVAKNDAGWLRRQARRLRRAPAPSATFLDSLSSLPVSRCSEASRSWSTVPTTPSASSTRPSSKCHHRVDEHVPDLGW